MKIHFEHIRSTKTCEVFQHGEKPDMITLYLKKSQLDEEGIRPTRGLTVTIEEAYHELIARDPERFVVVDATKSPEEIGQAALEMVLARLAEVEE